MVTNILTNDGFLTHEVILDLRKQIVLNSIYLCDYENDYNFDPKEVIAFFDGYLDYIGEIMEEDGISDEEFWERLPDYDNEKYLLGWYDCFDENPFNVNCLKAV